MPAPFIFIGLLLGAFVIAACVSTWLLKRWADRYESASRLGLFRIAYSCVLLCEIGQLIYCEPLIYDRNPGLIDNNMPISFVLYVWCVNTVLLAIGYHTRFVTITNFAFGLMVFSVSRTYEYHVDYAYTGINFLLLFAPIAKAYSVDARKSRRGSSSAEAPLVPAIYSQLIVFFGIGVVYADSCLWKFWSHNWTHGIGVFAFASHPGFAWVDFSPILESRLLSLASGYLTLTFEFLFVPLMWLRRPRYVLSVIGIALHVGILLVFPIPWFGLCMTALYILVWPTRYVDKPATPPQLSINDTAFGRLTLPQLRWLVAFMLALQFNASIIGNTRRLALPVDDKTAQSLETASHALGSNFSRPLFGIVTHPVFIDDHLTLAQNQFRITAVNKWTDEEWTVPITTKEGTAHPLNSGRLWVNWMFRVGPYFEATPAIRDQFYRALEFWTFREGQLLEGTTFKVESRHHPLEKQWQPQLMAQRRATPWTHVADVIWQDGKPTWVPNAPAGSPPSAPGNVPDVPSSTETQP